MDRVVLLELWADKIIALDSKDLETRRAAVRQIVSDVYEVGRQTGLGEVQTEKQLNKDWTGPAM